MRLTEQQYDEVLKQPIGTGIFVYRNTKNNVSQLKAKRTEVEVYRRTTKKPSRKNNKTPMRADYEPLLKAGIIGAIGLIILLMGAM